MESSTHSRWRLAFAPKTALKPTTSLYCWTRPNTSKVGSTFLFCFADFKVKKKNKIKAFKVCKEKHLCIGNSGKCTSLSCKKGDSRMYIDIATTNNKKKSTFHLQLYDRTENMYVLLTAFCLHCAVEEKALSYFSNQALRRN